MHRLSPQQDGHSIARSCGGGRGGLGETAEGGQVWALGPAYNSGQEPLYPSSGLALVWVPSGACSVCSAVWAEKSCLGLCWGLGVLGCGGGKAWFF